MRGECLSKVRVSYLLLISLSPWLCASFVEIASAGIELCTPTIHFPFRLKKQSSLEFGELSLTEILKGIETSSLASMCTSVQAASSIQNLNCFVSSKQPCRLWMLNQMAHSSLLGCRSFFRIHSIQSVNTFAALNQTLKMNIILVSLMLCPSFQCIVPTSPVFLAPASDGSMIKEMGTLLHAKNEETKHGQKSTKKYKKTRRQHNFYIRCSLKLTIYLLSS